MNKTVVFLPVSDVESYADWDDSYGYGNTEQIFMDDGIIVKKDEQDKWESHIRDFQKYQEEFGS